MWVVRDGKSPCNCAGVLSRDISAGNNRTVVTLPYPSIKVSHAEQKFRPSLENVYTCRFAEWHSSISLPTSLSRLFGRLLHPSVYDTYTVYSKDSSTMSPLHTIQPSSIYPFIHSSIHSFPPILSTSSTQRRPWQTGERVVDAIHSGCSPLFILYVIGRRRDGILFGSDRKGLLLHPGLSPLTCINAGRC